MKCAQAENLIPLFVSDDLPAREADALRAHLAGCPHCEAMAAEFADSRNWLRSLQAPAFDERALEDLRAAVLGAINGPAPRASWINGWLTPRLLLLAASLLLLAGLGLIARHFITKPAPDLTKEPRREAPRAPAPLGRDEARDEAPPSNIARRPRPAIRPVKPRAEAPANITPSPTAPTDLASVNAAGNREMLRIEMQTEDPNIRIIWFAPKPGASTQPNAK